MLPISKKITRLYLLALTVVALLSIGGQFLMQHSLKNQQNDSRVINIAGRQRMLSQKICKTALLLVYQKDNADIDLSISDLTQALELWEKCHTGLKNGYLDVVHIPVKNSDTIRHMFTGIEPHFQKVFSNATHIKNYYTNPDTTQAPDIQTNLSAILSSERAFLQGMDQIVFQYDTEAAKRVNFSQQTEIVLLSLTLFILLLEGFFIFRPAVRQIEHTLQLLIESEGRAQQVNEELIEVNHSLEETKEALLEATNQKYIREITEQKARSAYLVEGQEEERKRIAREIHDGLGQMLTALKFGIEKIGNVVDRSEKGQHNLAELRDLISQTIMEARTISFNLMPAVLSDFGVSSALKLLVTQTASSTGVNIKFTSDWKSERLAKNIEIGLYRIAQEAINNAVKYARANEIIVDLSGKKKYIHLKISDNGQGFTYNEVLPDLAIQSPAQGINNMKERAYMINGSIKITSQLGKGTQIHVKIPLTFLQDE